MYLIKFYLNLRFLVITRTDINKTYDHERSDKFGGPPLLPKSRDR